MFFMNNWNEEVGVLVDFDEGTISLSDLGIIFGSCYYVLNYFWVKFVTE